VGAQSIESERIDSKTEETGWIPEITSGKKLWIESKIGESTRPVQPEVLWAASRKAGPDGPSTIKTTGSMRGFQVKEKNETNYSRQVNINFSDGKVEIRLLRNGEVGLLAF